VRLGYLMLRGCSAEERVSPELPQFSWWCWERGKHRECSSTLLLLYHHPVDNVSGPLLRVVVLILSGERMFSSFLNMLRTSLRAEYMMENRTIQNHDAFPQPTQMSRWRCCIAVLCPPAAPWASQWEPLAPA